MSTSSFGAASRRDSSCAFATHISAIAAGLLVAACGGGGDGGSSGGTPDAPHGGAHYFPLDQGDRWLYQETWNGGEARFQVDVGGQATDGGHAATSLVFTALDGTLLENRDYGVDASGVTLYPTSSDGDLGQLLGQMLLIPARVDAGTSVVVMDRAGLQIADLDGDGRNDTVDVRVVLHVDGLETVTSQAITFVDALHQHVDQTITFHGSADALQPFTVTTHADEWFAGGIGRVRTETTTTNNRDGQVDTDTVELVAFRTADGVHAGADPAVTSTVPSGGQTRGQASAEVSATFSMPMEPASLDDGGFVVTDAGGRAVAGHVVVTPDGGKATFVPDAGWQVGQFTARITERALDRYGAAAKPFTWSFSFDEASPT